MDMRKIVILRSTSVKMWERNRLRLTVCSYVEDSSMKSGEADRDDGSTGSLRRQRVGPPMPSRVRGPTCRCRVVKMEADC